MDALQSKKKGRPSMKDKKIKPVVEGSIETLQAENVYLKRFNAVVQNKKQSPNKTKLK
ncbi:transposase (plasmid) [Bacillus thuringiensis serovar kurstaki str. HD-1]|nr:transposase [Bacillus thuringiensis serovar kurstaki str. HD-1]